MKTVGIALLLAGLLPAQEPPGGLKLPATVAAEPGQKLVIRADTMAKTILWQVPGELNHYCDTNGCTIVCWPSRAGEFRITAIVAIKDTPFIAECLVAVKAPVPPAPEDLFRADLAKLLAAETGPNAAEHVKQLAMIYGEAAKLCKQNPPSTVSQLVEGVRKTAASLIPDTALVSIRNRVRDELERVLPGGNQELNDDLRATLSDLFKRAASTLEGRK